MAKVGDKFFHPTFGGGVTVEVVAVLRHKVNGPSVRVRLSPALMKNPVRCWHIDTWEKIRRDAKRVMPPEVAQKEPK